MLVPQSWSRACKKRKARANLAFRQGLPHLGSEKQDAKEDICLTADRLGEEAAHVGAPYKRRAVYCAAAKCTA